MSGWTSFFVAEVGAAAALAGLIFVGVSISLQRIVTSPRLPNLALQALIVLVTILIVASLALTPGQPIWLLGAETLIVGVVSYALVLRLDIRSLRTTDPQYRLSYLIYMSLSQLATLPYIIAGLTLLLGRTFGLYWLVPAVLFSFIKAISDAWVLLIEINR